MKTVRTVSITALAVLMIVMCAVIASADSPVSPALGVIETSLTMDKSGVVSNDMSFSAQEFDEAVGISNVSSITILTLPDTAAGSLEINGVPVKASQVIKRSEFDSLTFVPSCNEKTSCTFTYGVVGTSDQYEIKCTLWMLDTLNFAPSVEVSAKSNDRQSITTYKNVSYFGTLPAHDPENDQMKFEIVSYPRKGLVIMTDDKTGSYKYMPATGVTGRDTFEYVVIDQYGNRSDTAKISVKITKPDTDIVYSDMAGNFAYNAALTLAADKIMVGETVGGKAIFKPDTLITRAEFLATVMKALDIDVDENKSAAVFEDMNDIPKHLLSYVATAYDLKYVGGVKSDENGGLYFYPNNAITRAEAAVMLNNILGIDEPETRAVFADKDSIPSWAQGAIYALDGVGILTGTTGNIAANANLTRADAAVMICAAMEYSD